MKTLNFTILCSYSFSTTVFNTQHLFPSVFFPLLVFQTQPKSIHFSLKINYCSVHTCTCNSTFSLHLLKKHEVCWFFIILRVSMECGSCLTNYSNHCYAADAFRFNLFVQASFCVPHLCNTKQSGWSAEWLTEWNMLGCGGFLTTMLQRIST